MDRYGILLKKPPKKKARTTTKTQKTKQTCPVCSGKGLILADIGYGNFQEPCGNCLGTGLKLKSARKKLPKKRIETKMVDECLVPGQYVN